MISDILPLLCLLASLLLVFSKLLSWLRDPLRDIPGPLSARFSRLWYLITLQEDHFEDVNIVLHRKYGKIVRLAPNWYSIDDPSAAGIIYGLGKDFEKSEWYSAWLPPISGRWSLFSDRSNKHHSLQRRKVASAYSMTSLVSYEPFVDNCTSILSQRFSEFAKAGSSVNMTHWLQCYAFDVIGEITFARRFGFLDQGQDVGGIVGSIERTLDYASQMGIYPALHPIVYKLAGLFRSKSGLAQEFNANFTQQVIRERKASLQDKTDGPPDLLSKFLQAHSERPDYFTDYNIYASCLQNIVAGSDTTSITLSAILYYLCKDERVYANLLEEVESMNPTTFQEAQKMPYLQAVIKEAMRMHPATGLPLWRIVPKGGAEIAGRFFPEGTTVGINCWVAHRNRDIFGNDADSFRPERWIEASPPQLSTMDRYYMPFGLGSRTCIGKNISLLEISKLIPKMVKEFHFKLVHPEAHLETKNRWFVKQQSFDCYIRER